MATLVKDASPIWGLYGAEQSLYHQAMKKRFVLGPMLTASLAVAFLPLTSGCASAPKAPFDTLKSSNVTVFRLQNYEPPPPPAPEAQPTPGAPLPIPGMPPEVQNWMAQGAQALQQLLMPGATNGGTPPPPAPPDAPRFYRFRILGQPQPVMDPELKERLGTILGDGEGFDDNHAACAYSELGISFSPQPGVNNDLLLSFSCNQIVAQTFAWPHQSSGMKGETVSALVEIVQKIFPAPPQVSSAPPG